MVEKNFGKKNYVNLLILSSIIGGLFAIKDLKSKNDRRTSVYGHSFVYNSLLSFLIFNYPNKKFNIDFISLPGWIIGLLMFIRPILNREMGNLGGILTGIVYYCVKKIIS